MILTGPISSSYQVFGPGTEPNNFVPRTEPNNFAPNNRTSYQTPARIEPKQIRFPSYNYTNRLFDDSRWKWRFESLNLFKNMFRSVIGKSVITSNNFKPKIIFQMFIEDRLIWLCENLKIKSIIGGFNYECNIWHVGVQIWLQTKFS